MPWTRGCPWWMPRSATVAAPANRVRVGPGRLHHERLGACHCREAAGRVGGRHEVQECAHCGGRCGFCGAGRLPYCRRGHGNLVRIRGERHRGSVPGGALLSMVAAKTLIPRAVLSVVVAIALVLLLGRLFYGWACPVTLGRRVKEFFKPVKRARAGGGGPLSSEPGPRRRGDRSAERGVGDSRLRRLRSLPRQAQRAFRLAPCGARRCAADDGCVRVPRVLPRVPIKYLLFAAVALLVSLFGAGDSNWSLLFVPAMLVIELVFCTASGAAGFCPIWRS